MASVACGSVGTGTDSVPVAAAPLTVTRTCQAPAVIIQRWPVNSRGSSADRVARSGDRRELRAGPGERQRHDAHVADVVVGREDFDVGDAGDGVRRPDRDEHAVRARPALEEHVRAADVRDDAAAASAAATASDGEDAGGSVRITAGPAASRGRREGRATSSAHDDQRRDQHPAPELRARRFAVEELEARAATNAAGVPKSM